MLKFFKPSLTAAMLAATFSSPLSRLTLKKSTLLYPVVLVAVGI